jgi:hypothetical protein
MGVKVTNNAHSTLAGTVTAIATSLSVQTGHGIRFPTASIASGDYFFVTLSKTNGDMEIVKVTDRTADTFTIVRAQDSISGVIVAREFALNDRVELRPVAALLNALPNRQLITADYTDASVTTVKLANSGVTAGSYGGLGKDLTVAVNSKGQVTSISETSGIIQTDTFSYTTAGGTQTWTKPAVGSLIRVQLWGAGGGGGRGGGIYGAGGGGGGGYVETWLKFADLSSTASIVVGKGGTGATAGGAGVDGTNSTFTAGAIVLTAYAGARGGTGTCQIGGGGAGAHSIGGVPTGGRLGGGVGGDEPYESSPTPAGDAGTIWGGGGGGFGVTSAASATLSPGGYAVWGGGGGGAGFNGSGSSAGGASIFGGSGGAGATGTTAASPGATPGGGGGGTQNAIAGTGGNGRCIVTVY